MKYDAIIIGSGLGGLSCGAYLARHGRKVLVLEKHGIPGGYATSFTRGDFTFDVGLHMINAVGTEGRMYPVLEECGIAGKVEFIRLKDFARVIYPEHDFVIPGGGLDEVIASFENAFPDERRGIRVFFDHMLRIYNDQSRFALSKMPFLLQLPLFPVLYRSFFPVANKTCAQLMDKHIRSPKLKTLLFSHWCYYGLPPSRLNLSYGVWPTMSFWMQGAYYIRGGNQPLPDAFVSVIRQHGGEILYNTKVASIKLNNQSASGVVTEQGTGYDAGIIISNASPQETFFTMLGREKVPGNLVRKTEAMEPSLSSFVVFLGLDAAFGSQLENRRDYELLVFDSYDHDQDFRMRVNGDAGRAGFYIVLNSNIDKSVARNNKFVMSICQLQGYDHWKQYEQGYFTKNKTDYVKEKKRMADVLIRRAERAVPNISKHIETMEIATPLTYKRYTGNYNGASYGWANIVKQANPLQRSPMKTPIRNLYLSSAWTFPGEGQMGVVLCGFKLGKQLAGK